MALGSGFSMDAVKCPECGGALRLPDGAENVLCPYCGVTIHVSYGSGSAGIDPDGTIRDKGTGYGLFRVDVPKGWLVAGTALQRTGSSSRPFMPQADLRDRAGGIMQLRVGDAGTRYSEGMKNTMAMYGGHLAGIDRTNYAEMPDPLMLADMSAANLATQLGGADLRFAGQTPIGNLEQVRQRAYVSFQKAAQAAGGLIIKDPFGAEVLRTYTLVCNGAPWKMASYVRLYAVKDGSGIGEGMMGGLAGMFGGLGGSGGGGLFGNLFGGGQQQAQQPMQGQRSPQAMQAQAQQMLSGGVPWCLPSFVEYNADGTIYWGVEALALFAAPAADYDAQFQQVFTPIATGLEMHPDIESLAIADAQQQAAQVQQSTNVALQQNQASFQAQQAAHRQQQAAFDAYNQSWSAASDAHHRQFMERSHQEFNRSAPDYSEAIRGVNTYVRSDGTEVELSVHADRAYENQAGDVIGGSGGFEPGADWTEIPRT